MRLLAPILLLVPSLALAQTMAPITASPLLAPTAQPSVMSQPPADKAPPPPAQAQDAPQPAPQPQLTWVPQQGVQLQVLDKVNAQNATVTVKVGQDAKFGSLSIQVQACSSHPADQPQDSAAFLTITDSHADTPAFRGWMLANNPALSMLQHPLYDVRVVGCRA